MTVVITQLTVHPDGTLATATPLPAGEHEASITLGTTGSRAPSSPRDAARTAAASALAQEFRVLRRGQRLDGISIRELIEEGRA